MVMNSLSNGNTSPSSDRHNHSNGSKSPSRSSDSPTSQNSTRRRNRKSVGHSSNSDEHDRHHHSSSSSHSSPHSAMMDNKEVSSSLSTSFSAQTNPQSQHNDPSTSTTVPPSPSLKPCYSSKLALVSVQNASYMGARTQLSLCPPGRARMELLHSLQILNRRKKKNQHQQQQNNNSNSTNNGISNNASSPSSLLNQPAPIRRSLSFQRATSITSTGSKVGNGEDGLYFAGFEKILGESGVAEYHHEEDKFLNHQHSILGTSSHKRGSIGGGSTATDLNMDDDEVHEDPSSGDEDDLDFLFDEDEDGNPINNNSINNNPSDKECLEPLYLCGTEAGSEIRGSANSGKIAFNFRKLKWFDAVTATDRATARQYLKKEIAKMKKRDVKALTIHLKKLQKREKRRLEIEKGRRIRTSSASDRLLDDDDDDSAHQFSGIGKLPSPMTPSLSAALVLESLSLNPLESLDGMAKCYEGIVAAGSALLDSKLHDPTSHDSHKKKHSKEEIVNALAPLLITTLEQASGDTIVALARLRKSCGTKRYQRRFVQRIAPCLIRPPNASIWCLRHQQDMESILAATELILDKSTDIFHKEWFEHGKTILADSKRAETLKAAAMQLKSLSVYQPSDHLMKGFSAKKGVNHRRARSGSLFKATMDHGASGTSDVMAEWEILAVDRQIRDSIHNLFSKDWQRVVLPNAPPRDGESQSKKLRGITAGKSRPTSTDIDASSVSSNEQFVTSPPRLSQNRMLPSTNASSTMVPNGSRNILHSSQEGSPATSRYSEQKHDMYRYENFDPTTPPHTPRNNDSENTPPRSPPHTPSYHLSPRTNVLSPKFMDSVGNASSSVERSSSPAPLSPVNSHRRQHESNQRFSSTSSGSSPSAQSKYLRTLTSTAAERKRTVAACRALRAQISRFEDAFFKSNGHYPRGTERSPLSSTYGQYREWKRAIRTDAASRIQALARGARLRSYLSQDPRFKEIVRRRAGRPNQTVYNHLSMPDNIISIQSPNIPKHSISPISRRDDGNVEIIMGPASSWSKHSLGESSHDSSTYNTSQFSPRNPGSVRSSNTFKLEIAHLSLPELQTQKRELKQELKKYDMEFFKRHQRMPIKAEKEPIRHLYEQYNQLKNRITAVERDPSSIQQSAPVPRRKTIESVSSPTIVSYSNQTTDKAKLTQSVMKISEQNVRKTTVASSRIPSDLGALKLEKGALHTMLRSYEKEFFKKYQRQVSSFEDIAPVETQYKRYKLIKKRIATLQSQGKN